MGEATREATDAPPTDSVSVSSPSAASDRSPWLAPSISRSEACSRVSKET